MTEETQLRYVENYKHNDKLRHSLDRLVQETFGITFEKWFQAGEWDRTYVPHAWADGDEIIANLSTTSLTWRLDGEDLAAVQVGTVMTREAYRGQGLNSSLMKKAIENHRDADLMYLFADEEAIPYYEKYGFKAYRQKRYSLEASFPKSPRFSQMTKLDITQAHIRAIIKEMCINCFDLKRFMIIGGEGLLMWYLLNFYMDDIYYIEDLETIVIGKADGDSYDLLRIIAPEPYELDKITEYIFPEDVKRINFGFTPDDGLSYTVTESEEPIFIRSDMEFTEFEQYTMTAKA